MKGEVRVVGASKTSVTVIEEKTEGITRAFGATVPTDADAGYAVGCIFVDSDGGESATFYINEGSATSCDFNITGGGAAGATGYTGYTGYTGSSDLEFVNLEFGNAITGVTGTVTADSTIIGSYISAVSGSPQLSFCKLVVADTTITGTVTVAPGTGDYFTVTASLLKA